MGPAGKRRRSAVWARAVVLGCGCGALCGGLVAISRGRMRAGRADQQVPPRLGCVWRPAPPSGGAVAPPLLWGADEKADDGSLSGGHLKRWDMSRVASEPGYEPPMDLFDPGQVVVTVAYDESEGGGYAPMRMPGVESYDGSGDSHDNAVLLGGKGFGNLVGVSNAALDFASRRGFGFVFPKLVQTESVHPMPDGNRRGEEWANTFGIDACYDALRLAWGLENSVPAVKRGRPWHGGGRVGMDAWACYREVNATACLHELGRGGDATRGRLVFVAADQCYRATNRRALCWPHQLVWRWPFWVRPPEDKMRNALHPGILRKDDVIVVVLSERKLKWHFDTVLSGPPLRERFRALSPRSSQLRAEGNHGPESGSPRALVRVVLHQRLGDIVGMFRDGWHRANTEKRPSRVLSPNPNRVTKYVPPSYFVASIRALSGIIQPRCMDIVILTDAALETNDPRHPGGEDVRAVVSGLQAIAPVRLSWNGKGSSDEWAHDGVGSIHDDNVGSPWNRMRVTTHGGDSPAHGPRATFTDMTNADILVCGGSGFSRLAAVLADASAVKIAPQASSHPLGQVPGVVELPRQGPREILEGRIGSDPLGIESGWWEAALGAPHIRSTLRGLVRARLSGQGIPAKCIVEV